MWAAIRASWPLFIGMIFLMVSNGLLTTLLTLRGSGLGFSDSAIGMMQSGYPVGSLLGCMTIGGMLFQFPMGKLSDIVDRHLVIVIAPALSIPICVLLASMDNPSGELYIFYLLVVLLGGLTLPIYSICMAHMNDHLKPSQIIAASGTLVLILAPGMTVEPTLGGIAIQHYGPQGIFYLFTSTASLTALTGLFRWWHAPATTEHRSATVAVSSSLTPEATNLYPDASTRDDAAET